MPSVKYVVPLTGLRGFILFSQQHFTACFSGLVERITLVRSAKVVSFETVAQIDSGVRERPEVSYGDDDELTIPIELDELTVPRHSTYTPSGTKAARVPAPAAAYPTAPYPAAYAPPPHRPSAAP